MPEPDNHTKAYHILFSAGIVSAQAQNEVVKLLDQLDLAKKAVGSCLWCLNNAHNYNHPDFQGYVDAAREDAKRAGIEA